jgi:hypothetical protein
MVLCTTAAVAAQDPPESSQGPENDTREVREILQGFVESYRVDPMALTTVFGIRIGDDWWHVRSVRRQKPYPFREQFTFHHLGPHEVTLHEGPPEKPTWFFSMPDRSVLENLKREVLETPGSKVSKGDAP